MSLRERHLWGAGAAACAVCCAAPILALLGIAGAGLAATIATLAFAGLVFGVVVAAATIGAIVVKRRRDHGAACQLPADGPVEVSLTSRPSDLA